MLVRAFLLFALLKQSVEAGRQQTQLRISAPVAEANTSQQGVKLESAVAKWTSACRPNVGKSVPKMAKFQICNAYSPHLTMKVEIGRGRASSSIPTAYGDCVELVTKTFRHDVVVIHLEGQMDGAPHVDGDGPGGSHRGYGQQRRSVETYLKRDACANNSAILFAVTGHGTGAGGLEMHVAYFEYLVRPQVALVDGAPYGTSQQQVTINPEKSEYISDPVDLAYEDIKAIAPGVFDVELDGKKMDPQLTAECDVTYSIIRLAKGKLMVFPKASSNPNFGCQPAGQNPPPRRPQRSSAQSLSIFLTAAAGLVALF